MKRIQITGEIPDHIYEVASHLAKWDGMTIEEYFFREMLHMNDKDDEYRPPEEARRVGA